MNNRVSTIVFWVLGAANLALTVLLLVLLVMGFANRIDMTAVSGIVAGLSVSVFSWIGWLRQNEETKRAKAERSTTEIEYYYQSGLSDSVFAMDILAKEVWKSYAETVINEYKRKNALLLSIVFVKLCKLTKYVLYFRQIFGAKSIEKMGQFASHNNNGLNFDEKEISTLIQVIGESANRIKHERGRLSSLIENEIVNPETFAPIFDQIKSTDDAFRPIAEAIKNLI